MVNFPKNNHKNRSVPGAVILGIIISLLVSILFAVLITALIRMGYLADGTVQLSTYLAMTLSTFIGILAATAGKEEKQIPLCGITAAGIYLCYLGGGALVFGSGFHGIGTGVITVLSGSTAALLINILSKYKAKNPKRKYRFR